MNERMDAYDEYCDDDLHVKKADEESGWTSYFEDSSNTTSSSSSLLSDAASKFSHPNFLTFNKTTKLPHDPNLEDTASSPLNSPKVRELNPATQKISRNTADQLYDSMGKGFTSEHNSESQGDNKDEMINFNGKNNNEFTDQLKKRGLCLVPLSMHVA
ncbi:vascular-related protein 1 [Senna tora]|uniref:Vascular-related protein 1 n=1 Tax=Senna tora TaxID=362788 RepID=A0A834SL17_9FABA|nr:vascular-related protein 1 [Senna tora]